MLDQFPQRYATDLYIVIDQIPYFGATGNYSRSDHVDKVDMDELIEDLAALGVTEHAVEYFIAYTTSSGEKLYFKTFTILSSGKVVSSRFMLIQEPSDRLKLTLATTNPILESAYYELPAF